VKNILNYLKEKERKEKEAEEAVRVDGKRLEEPSTGRGRADRPDVHYRSSEDRRRKLNKFGYKGEVAQVKGGPHSTVFIAIASFRDKECAHTLLDLFQNAAFPQRLHVNIVEHVSTSDETESCWDYARLGNCDDPSSSHTICRYKKNILILSKDYLTGRGPLDARHEVQSLLQDEEFAMMLDAHMMFTPNWDAALMDNWNELGDELGIITTYPNGFVLREDGVPKVTSKSVLCQTKFNEDLHIPRHQGGHDTPYDGSHLTPFWSACISFGKAHAFRAVMFDCCAPYTFEGEEFSYSIRLWTHGYDFYTPKTNVVFHQYFHPGVVDKGVQRKKYSDVKWDSKFKVMLSSNERLRRMLRMAPDYTVENVNMTDIDKYGLGNVRSREDYIRFSSVDLDNRMTQDICDDIIADKLSLIPLQSPPVLKTNGFTVDPHPLLMK